MKSIQEFYDQQWGSTQGDMFSLAFTEAITYSYACLGDLHGKKLLEIGCGSGEQAVYFASQGALTTVIDVSPESLKATQQMAKARGVSLVVHQMNAEKMLFKDEQFDLIYINSVLMHVNQEKVLQECARVLKKGGKLVIIEPLKYAPLVQAYRLFSSYRKMKPRYATFKMFESGKNYFSEYEHTEFYLFASLLLPAFYYKNKLLHQFYHLVARSDDFLLRILPPLRRLCWVSVVEYRK